MSYPNFSYYNGPSASKPVWGPSPAAGRGAVSKVRPSWPTMTVPATTTNHPIPGQPLTGTHGFVHNIILPSDTAGPRHQVLQGKVTQMFSNFGYINDDIIFSICDVMGPMVQVGDKVAVDATFQPNNPTKYKGERVCKIDESRFRSGGNSNYGKMKTLSQGSTPQIDITIQNRLGESYDEQEPSSRSELPVKNRLGDKYDIHGSSSRSEMPIRDRLGNKYESSRRSSEKSHSSKWTDEVKDKKSSSIKSRLSDASAKERISIITSNTSKARKRMSRKTEELKRKAVSPLRDSKSTKVLTPVKTRSESKSKNVPKHYENFACRELDCALLKLQCRTLTLPNELFHVSLKYQQSFPLNHPMKLGNNCHFKILDKKIKSIDNGINEQINNDIDPQDADSTFVAKVMLLSTDDLAKFYKDTLILAEEFDSDNKVPITKAIKFLVGSIGENKEFGIGGAWSPSLDGPDPESNPRVLINTAIRTCKSMTGIDLSNCSSWQKFLELHYYRPTQKLSSTKRNKEIVIDLDNVSGETNYKEPQMETVVYYIPDVWNCVPSQDSWNEIKRLYQEQLTCIMCPPPTLPKETTIVAVEPATTVSSSEEKKTSEDNQEEEDYNFNDPEIDTAKNIEDDKQEEQPTHYSKLTIASMKIIQIKKELELRKLNSRGVMEQLKARLKGALEKEENEEKNKDGPKSTNSVTAVKKSTEITLSENDKNELKKLYTLPDRPEILVHQNRKMLNNQMKIRAMSLHSLLSYYSITLEECTFELAIFAKQFLEMMRRDAVFNIYKSIVMAQESDLINVEDSNKKPKLMVTTSKRTVNRPLLFSCSLLDRDKTNKLSLDDLKVHIEGLGICLSSKQLSEVLGKIKDTSKFFNYRQLTDKVVTDGDVLNLMNIEFSDDLDYIKELAIGNKALFESESSSTEMPINDEEMERLKNELDKSERCRQSVELKVAEMKDETEKSINLAQSQAKEILKLKEQVLECKTKYHNEQNRGNLYKRDLEKLLRQMKDIDKLALSLSKSVTGTLDKFVTDTKKSNKDEPSSNTDIKSKVDKNPEKIKNIESIVFDLTNEHSITADKSNDIEMVEKVITNGVDVFSDNVDKDDKEDTLNKKVKLTAVTAEDFELSKPSDYDMIILDEAE